MKLILALLPLLAALSLAAAPNRSATPNIVIVFCDDLGYADVGCFGAKGYKTPNIDRLAREGVRFTRFYDAQPVCSASRSALMTGCYPSRIGIMGALGPNSKVGISSNEVTLAEIVKSRGYATAIYGKWHLGDQPQFLPTRHGFDHYFGLPYSNDMWPWHPDQANKTLAEHKRRPGYPELRLIENEQTVIATVTGTEQAQLTTWYTEHAVDFIAQNKSRPFFLYVPHSMPHVPLYVSSKFKGKSKAGLFGDVIMEIDWSVGQILGALKKHRLEKNTLVIFTSDNGPWLSYGNHAGSALPLREGKGTCWDGGVRVPFIARWPGKIPKGSVCQEPAMTIDILPTVAKLVGAELPPHKIDGLDIWPLLACVPGAKNPHEAYYLFYENNQLQAVMGGNWKLQLPHTYRTLAGGPGGRDGTPASYQQRKLESSELYDLDRDIGEATNVAGQNPDMVKRLEALAEQARAELGDSLTKRIGKGVREPGRIAEGN
ncbi:MAG: sulfatase [Verrucomicrobia subdivision 3 bacterium]|nr:sulfatase [Limisphaerales bacterium]